ncbi:roadblock/LC7 domain-containing protein [Vannielia litorea]|uniref:roadblock/LC7 domain-containing protein n=1 Tax=Vannielia TaxID=2813041 RepID=UPI001C94C9C7|nr:roadblock/LC7 domain-containing protein [Vannielia litorea]MBY6049661.1 roadblock/LC7 domain-containing protein [Vannielia litorea]MBY6077075.1 roadblock/LC7 domain-containing protein [Vannielia litorea]MBY6155681.1 roadblock/LC7 domain-containing protein [Vannielia litorea]
MSTDLSNLTNLDGFIGACLVDSESGMMLASEDGNGILDLETAGAANMEVVRAKNAAMQSLGLEDRIEDIMISLGSQIHLIRPLASNPDVFIYVALDRAKANLGMARLKVRETEGTLKV